MGADLRGFQYSIMEEAMAEALAALSRENVPDKIKRAGRRYAWAPGSAWQAMLYAASQMRQK